MEIALAAQDEESHGLVETMEAAEIAIVAIHDDEATGLHDDLIQSPRVVPSPVREVDERRYAAF